MYDRPVYILLSLMISKLIYMERISVNQSVWWDKLLKPYEVTKRSWNVYYVPRKYYNPRKYPCLAKSFTAILVYKWENELWPLFR